MEQKGGPDGGNPAVGGGSLKLMRDNIGGPKMRGTELDFYVREAQVKLMEEGTQKKKAFL